MDLPVSESNTGDSLSFSGGSLFDHEGVSELSAQPELMSNSISWPDWGLPLPPGYEADWAANQSAGMNQQNGGDMLSSNRTRSGRRINQPAARDVEVAPINRPPAPVKAGARKRKRQNRQINIICNGCYRGNSPSNNLIVLCDSCDAPWHQKCHNPNIDNEIVEVPEMNWFCIGCKPDQGQRTQIKSGKKVSAKGHKGTYQKVRVVSKQQVGGIHYSEEERRAYLSSLSHEMLVQLVIKVSNEWPSVPMFPPNLQSVTASTPSLPPSSHINQPSNSTPNAAPGFPFFDEKNMAVNSQSMDPRHQSGVAPSTTAPHAISTNAAGLSTTMAPENAIDPALLEPAGETTTDQGFAGISHAHPAPIVPAPAVTAPSATTNPLHPSTTVLKYAARAAKTNIPARKTSNSSWNSNLLTDGESSDSQSRPRSPPPFVSRSSQVGSYHESDYDSEDYRAYPQPGQGFQVSSDPNDLAILAEDGNCPTFSHRRQRRTLSRHCVTANKDD
ncbi:Zinc finger PHD-finger [Penicillium sp. DV-2018c]|nr:Zinc finger PHD-finger [Penicillium sp. DV-2018c]